MTSLYPAIDAHKLEHAVALHAIQVLCVAGFLADRWLSRKIARWIVLAVTLAIGGGLAFATVAGGTA